MDCERLPDMNVARHCHALLDLDGEITAIGGHTTGFVITRSAEYYKDGRWHLLSPFYTHDDSFCTLLPDGRILVGGGYEKDFGIGQTWGTEVYDPATHAFAHLPILDQKRTQLWIRLGLAMIVVLALRFSGIALDAAVVLAVVTICYLLVNAVQAGMLSGTGREAKLLFLGLLLFLLCEFFAGLHLLGNALPGLPAGLVRMAEPLSRTFDLPAQVVLLFGGVREEAG